MNSLWCFAIFLSVVISSSYGQEVPNTPCPSTFRYQFDNGAGEWIGLGRIAKAPIGEDIILYVTLSVGTQLTSSYVGEVKILGQPSEIANRIYSGQPLNFEVRFPIQNPLPEVSTITVNDNVICRAEYSEIALLYVSPICSLIQKTYLFSHSHTVRVHHKNPPAVHI